MRYINSYATSGDVQTAINNGELGKPYVAYVQDGQYIDWNSKGVDYTSMPLTFEILSDGVIRWVRSTGDSFYERTIKYSKNGGEWTNITSDRGDSAPSISVNTGDVIKFLGDNQGYGFSIGFTTFSASTCQFNVFGNIMSLINSENYTNLISLTSNKSFNGLFQNCTGLTDSSDLVLPATTLTEDCYDRMFENCTSLTGAPELPATTLANTCYQAMFGGCTSLATAPELPSTAPSPWSYSFMFNGCRNLNYVKCLATDISASNCTNTWLNNVSSTGTFVTPSSTSWGSGSSGIPNNWTRVDA